MRAPWLILLERRFTHCLQSDAALAFRTPLDHKTLQILVEDTPLLLTISVQDTRFFLSHDPFEDKTINVRIRAKLSTLLKLLRTPKQRHPGVYVEGDLAVLDAFSQIMELARKDPLVVTLIQRLEPYVGAAWTYQIAKGYTMLQGYAESRLQSLKLDLRDYLQEELKLLPCEPEVSEFVAEVDNLQLDTERLIARLKALQ